MNDDKREHARHRSIAGGLGHLLFGLVISLIGTALLLGVLLVVVMTLLDLKNPSGVLLSIVGLALFAPMAIVLLTLGTRQVRLGYRYMQPAGVGMDELHPMVDEMQRGEYTYRSFGNRVGPLVAGSMVFFCVAFLGLIVAAVLKQASGTWGIELAVALALLAVVAGGFLYLWLQGRKFGKSVCRYRDKRPEIGGTLDAEVTVECPGMAAGMPPLPLGPVGIKLQLVAMKGGVTWETTAELAPEGITRPGDGTLRIPVRLPIPAESATHLAGGRTWRLRLQASYPGIDYASAFHPIGIFLPKARAPAPVSSER